MHAFIHSCALLLACHRIPLSVERAMRMRFYAAPKMACKSKLRHIPARP